MKKIIAMVGLVALCGCNTVTVYDPVTGFEIKRCANAFSKTALGPFEITDGTKKLKLGSYQQESLDSFASITAAFAAGFKSGMEAYQGRTPQP
jgi:hypothetical protein